MSASIPAVFLVLLWSSLPAGATQIATRYAHPNHSSQASAALNRTKPLHKRDVKRPKRVFVFIGAIPGKPELATKINKMLKRADIQAEIGGSKSYGIVVDKRDQDKAIALLRKAMHDQKLPIELCKPRAVAP